MSTHVRQNLWKVSSNFKHHSKPTMNINSQRHNLHGNQISPKSEDFCIWRSFCTLVTMATAAILIFVQPPKAATYYGGYSYKVDHNIAPKPSISIPNIKINLETKFPPNRRILYFGGHFWFKMAAIANQRWISIRNIIIYLESKFRPNRRIFVFWRPVWIQNGHHRKPTMNINLQHHNLLGSQISPISDDFFIWRPFCTLVTMATAAISIFFQPCKSCHILRWKFLQCFMKFDERNPKKN